MTENCAIDCVLPSAVAPPALNSPKPKVIDLFAGVGGLSLGAARAGFHLALAVEIDKHAMSAHQQNFPGFNHLATDISLLDGEKIMHHAGLAKGGLDGLFGGPPCQGFSVIGKRSAIDPRNNLFVKFFDLVAQCQPKFFVAENVLGILEDKYSGVREAAFERVGDGYVILPPMRMKASDYGAPTSRERVFFIGYRSDAIKVLSTGEWQDTKVTTPTTVAEALCGLPPVIDRNWLTEEQSWQVVESGPASVFWSKVVGAIPDEVGDAQALRRYREDKLVSGCFGTRHSPEVEARYEKLKHGEKDKTSKAVRLKPDGFCPTLRAGTDAARGSYQAVRPIHPAFPRVITPREAARLQGFPDWFQFAPSKWHSFRQIGNSVSPIVAEAVFSVIKAHL